MNSKFETFYCSVTTLKKHKKNNKKNKTKQKNNKKTTKKTTKKCSVKHLCQVASPGGRSLGTERC